ncbi:MAG: flagellar hook protein FlgE [Thioalkalivibrionaceae bacterium]
MPFRIGLSGLNAASADLRVTGHNIANSATTGFKNSRAEFADVYAFTRGGVSKRAIGSGVKLQAVTQQFSQGNIEFTQNGLDLAVSGDGFFILNDRGNRVYTRAGAFQVDREGFIVNSENQRLQGFSPITPDTRNPRFNTGQLNDIRLQQGEGPPRATSAIEALVNLRSDAVEPEVAPFDLEDPETYNFSTSLTIFDSLGTPRNLTLFYVKGADPLEWEVNIGIEGELVGTQALTFDENGLLDDPTTPVDFTFDLAVLDPDNGAAELEFSIDFRGTTQFGSRYSVNDLQQDGFTTGSLSGIDVDQTGVVFARFTNGQSQILGQVALANFTNPQGLQQLGDNNWAEAFAAGEPRFGQPGSSDLGLIQSAALEASNVDIAQELVRLITAQRNFQANAQVISAADQVTQTIINIR